MSLYSSGAAGFMNPGAIPWCPFPNPACSVWNSGKIIVVGGVVIVGVITVVIDQVFNNRFPTLEEVQRSCVPGRLVVEPATSRRMKGGTSYCSAS